MGSGKWSSSNYVNRTTRPEARAAGTSFVHDSLFRSGKVSEIHESLKPDLKAGAGSPFVGSVMRESRDSDEHPETVPVAVFFDVTGSMGALPRTLQEKLPALYAMLMTKGYVEHPQVLFGAVGDANSDRFPLQVGQFESDNRADENLDSLILEGNGGGGNHESYELAAYFMANHTATDAWDKRGRRGYLFFVGDERLYSAVNRSHVERLIGDALQESPTTPDVFDALKERWDVYFLFASQGSYKEEQVLVASASTPDALGWREVLGQNALVLEDAAAVCETIALTIGIGEGAVDLDAGLDDLADIGSDAKAIEATSRALSTVGAGVASRPGDASGDLDLSGDDGAERL